MVAHTHTYSNTKSGSGGVYLSVNGFVRICAWGEIER